MVTAASRRDARERAVELLYEAEVKGLDPAAVVDALPLTPDAYALELALGVTDHHIEIDALLERYARNWSLGRMAATDRTVLRVGAFELATQHDVPTGAALSEAVDLAGQYGSTDDTSRFVNGILANVAREVRPEAAGSRGGSTAEDPVAGVSSRVWTDVKTVVFDMDGVIRHWHVDCLQPTEERLGLPAGAIGAAAFAQPLFRQAMVGERTMEEWAAEIGDAVAGGHGVSADDVAAAWLATTWDLDRSMIALIDGLRAAGTRVALFSNASTKLEADLVECDLADRFDVVANSSRIGAVKPDVAAFDHVAGMVDAEPDTLLFVDDTAENVRGAVDAGWHAVLMRGTDRFGGVLRRLAVPGAPPATSSTPSAGGGADAG